MRESSGNPPSCRRHARAGGAGVTQANVHGEFGTEHRLSVSAVGRL